MIERDVKNKIKRIIAKYEQQGHVFWSYWPVQTGFGKHGIPDVLVCVTGYLIAIECKVDGKQPTTRQWHEISSVAASYGVAIVIDQHNISDVEATFEMVLRGDHLGAIGFASQNRIKYRPPRIL
jgi:hypothetical protein